MPTRTFLHQLFSILGQENLQEWIYWTEDDTATFAIKPYAPQFSTKILKGYFKHGNVSSFVRQLHMYGFHKLSNTNNRVVTNTNSSLSDVTPTVEETDSKEPLEKLDSPKDREKMYHPPVPQDRAQTIWYFTHPSGVFHKNADTSDLEKIHRKSTGSKDSKRKNILSPVNYSYVECKNMNIENANMQANKLHHNMYEQGYLAYQQQQQVQNACIVNDPYGQFSQHQQINPMRHQFRTSPIPTPPPIPYSSQGVSVSREEQLHQQMIPGNGPTTMHTHQAYHAEVQPSVTPTLQGTNTVSKIISNSNITTMNVPNKNASPHSISLTNSISSQQSNNTTLPGIYMTQSSNSNNINSVAAPSNNATTISHPTPTRTPIVVPPPQHVQTSQASLHQPHLQLQHQSASLMKNKYNSLAKAVLTLTDIVDSMSQSSMHQATTGRISQNIDYYKISQTLQLIRDDIIHNE